MRLILYRVEEDATYGPQDEHLHLCPLIRAISKGLAHLEFGAPHICSELFFDETEMESMRKNGVWTRGGIQDGDNRDTDLDSHAIRQTIQECRHRKRTNYRNQRITDAIGSVKTQSTPGIQPEGLFGRGTNAGAVASRARREMERELDEEEEQRKRSIQESKLKWFRRYISWHGSCDLNQTWAEMRIGADMEEEGVELVLISMADLLMSPSALLTSQ